MSEGSRVEKFTPGPWMLSDIDNLIETEQGRVVGAYQATNRSGQKPPEREIECAANGNLIAAAPELYEALKAITWACDDPNGADSGQSLAMALSIALPAARAALAKARGETVA